MSEIKLRVARMQSLLEEIAQERERQDAKWGWPRRHGMEKWFLILLEEMGEASECLLQMESGDKPGDWPASFEKEMVQVIAVGVAMLQQFREREESLGAWASRTVKDGVGAEEPAPAATSFRPKQPCTEPGCGGTMSLRRYEGRSRWFCDRGGLIGMGGAENEGQHDGVEEPVSEPRPRCHAGRDGDCIWEHCPQLRDKEPESTHRHCPLDREHNNEV